MEFLGGNVVYLLTQRDSQTGAQELAFPAWLFVRDPDEFGSRLTLVAEHAQTMRTIATRYATFISMSSILRRFGSVR
ncbi:MAG TPA: hypothetical protein VI585_05235 [Candidatus Binatia bacterium]